MQEGSFYIRNVMLEHGELQSSLMLSLAASLELHGHAAQSAFKAPAQL
jgi:hypothetical protein